MKNRTVIGIICMILAVAIAFGIAPMVSRMAEGKVDVLTFTQNLGKGAQITEDDITVTSLLRAGLPEGAISAKSKTDVIGKYTNSDVYKGDVVTPSKLADSRLNGITGTLSDIFSCNYRKNYRCNSDVTPFIWGAETLCFAPFT